MFTWRSGATGQYAYSTNVKLRPSITLPNDVFIAGGDGGIADPWTVE
ncbi:hypothetical protein IJ847_02920 [Candidatus Saccharibacteria bacterium]|nr:hypothetical protein [Candidatus Saccharibacteria bacterium]